MVGKEVQEIKCSKCGTILVEGKNWCPSFVKRGFQCLHICKQCWSKNTKKRIKSRTSKALGTVFCSKCGELGQLKLRTTMYKSGRSFSFLQVDHYRIPNYHGSGYVRSCYLGKKTNLTTKTQS